MFCTLAVLPACDMDAGLAGPPPIVVLGGGPGGGTSNSAVIGTWTRTVQTVDDAGKPLTVETTWAFNSDATALRSIITRDVTTGTSQRQDAFGNWQVVGTELVIDFVAPFTGQQKLTFSREGDQLILGGQTFLRAF